MRRFTSIVVVAQVMACAAAGTVCAQAVPSASEHRAQVAAVAGLPGQPGLISAAGSTRDGSLLVSLENPSAFEAPGPARRLVLVGGLDGDPDSARLVLDAVRWFKTAAPEATRRQRVVSALPLAAPGSGSTAARFPPDGGFFDHPERPETRYVWRWVAYQTPDLVVEVQASDAGETQVLAAGHAGPASGDTPPEGSLAAALADANSDGLPGSVAALRVTVSRSARGSFLGRLLGRAPDARSDLRATVARRLDREPLEVARVLAARYPGTPGLSYIPGVAWMHTLRLASIARAPALREKVLSEVGPWLRGEQPITGERISLAAVAGTMVFAELARTAGDHREAAADLAARGVRLAATERAPGEPEHGAGWTDDMFLGTIAAATAGDPDGLDAAARLLVRYGDRLQQSTGIFHHSPEAPTAWGRGNGFAALGLAETLSRLPGDHPDYARVLEIYRKQMRGLRAYQGPDGMWRQVVDMEGSYRELSVTALTLTAMARGLRSRWLDPSYRPVVERAWRGLLAHVAEDGTLVDVCISTGAGPTLRHYLDRTAVNGANDRGGALALGAALEMHALTQGP